MQHTNNLIHSSSPYLLQHAHNPVDWHIWSDEALQKAIAENKPILVSIGYSSCHWCHVMEHESFEDEATASIMNEHFINIKIDREERPDLDHIYMDAVQAMTGSGGWPLNVFLTPQLKPFYGGTYFPPKPAHGRMSWKDTLLAVNKAFNERYDEIESQATKLTEHIVKSNVFSGIKNQFEDDSNEQTLQIIAENILKNADSVWGGFGGAPKFPQTFSIQFLLRQYYFTKEEKYLQQAVLSLDKMIFGGIYDQIGGGFARYSTDEKWFAPHFEKMLYDNALLISVLSEAYQITKKTLYKEIIEQTLAFIEREMMSDEFAFFSAIDADSEGVEGKFYVFTKTEIKSLLGENADLFCQIFNVEEDGNWEHSNIFWLQKCIDDIAKEKNWEADELNVIINSCKQTLLKARTSRVRPLLDDKVLFNWNALMNIAYCKAFAATGDEHYRKVAIKNMNFLQAKMVANKSIKHCYKNGTAYIDGFLDDYAYFIWALIHLQEITGNQEYLFLAKEYLEETICKFGDDASSLFFYTAANQADVIVRKIDVYDGATPSANAIICHSINYLAQVFNDDILRKRFLRMIVSLQPAIIKHPTSFAAWASAMQIHIKSNVEVVITGRGSNAAITDILDNYAPHKILIASEVEDDKKLPILCDKKYTEKPTFYLCKNYICLPPVNSLIKFLHFYNK